MTLQQLPNFQPSVLLLFFAKRSCCDWLPFFLRWSSIANLLSFFWFSSFFVIFVIDYKEQQSFHFVFVLMTILVIPLMFWVWFTTKVLNRSSFPILFLFDYLRQFFKILLELEVFEETRTFLLSCVLTSTWRRFALWKLSQIFFSFDPQFTTLSLQSKIYLKWHDIIFATDGKTKKEWQDGRVLEELEDWRVWEELEDLNVIWEDKIWGKISSWINGLNSILLWSIFFLAWWFMYFWWSKVRIIGKK